MRSRELAHGAGLHVAAGRSMRDKLQKVQQQEEERQRTSMANVTANAMLGDARWAKWAAMANKPDTAPGTAAVGTAAVGASGAAGGGVGAGGRYAAENHSAVLREPKKPVRLKAGRM